MRAAHRSGQPGSGGIRPTPLLGLAALGIVFGDIGTSPLYALGTVFSDAGSSEPLIATGMTSMVVWTVALVVTVLYVRILMRYDDDGEGGLLAVLALLRRASPTPAISAATAVIAILGAGMFLGDGMITPAISVLSAVEGLTVANPDLGWLVVPVTVVVLVALLGVQRFGTARIGGVFGPIMLCWFGAAAGFGLASILQTPGILAALSPPHWIVLLVWAHPWTAVLGLGGVVLAITGAEALYADMGHFGRRPITQAWFAVVFPALLLVYLGQGAVVLRDPGAASNPFFSTVPTWALPGMVVLATVATVIASQSVISGAFSVVQQAGRLDLLPHLRIVHTSTRVPGQIYLPAVNVLLGAMVLALVLGFRSSAALGAAYGIAVTLTISTTATLLLLLLAITGRLRSIRAVVVLALLVVVLALFAANLTKIPTGGWLPLSVGAVLFVVMWVWQRGQTVLASARRGEQPPITDVAQATRALPRTPGLAVYLTHHGDVAPRALTTMIAQSGTIPEQVISCAVRTLNRAHGVRTHGRRLAEGFWALEIGFGYRDPIDVIPALARAEVLIEAGIGPDELAQASFVLSSNTPVANPNSALPGWQQSLYLTLARITPGAELGYRLPVERTIVIGRELSL